MWAFSWGGHVIFERSLTDSERHWLDLESRGRHGDAAAEAEFKELWRRDFEQMKQGGEDEPAAPSDG